MLRVAIITYGVEPEPLIKEFTIQGAISIERIKRLKTSVLTECDFIIFDTNFNLPFDLDGTAAELLESEIIEWMNTKVFPGLEKEGKAMKVNGKWKYIKEK